MCECISNFTKEIKDHYKGKFKNKSIENIKINTLMSFDGSPETTYSEAMISLVGQKKEHAVILKHSFCPFCGEKYES